MLAWSSRILVQQRQGRGSLFRWQPCQWASTFERASKSCHERPIPHGASPRPSSCRPSPRPGSSLSIDTTERPTWSLNKGVRYIALVLGTRCPLGVRLMCMTICWGCFEAFLDFHFGFYDIYHIAHHLVFMNIIRIKV